MGRAIIGGMPGGYVQLICVILLVWLAGCKRSPSGGMSQATPGGNPSEQFLSLMNAGKNYFDQGDATNALAIYKKAEAIEPNDLDLRLNLANSYLAAGNAPEAIKAADEVLKLEPNSAAACFIKGAANLRLSNADEAVKALENSKKIDPGEISTFFLLGTARMGLKQWDEAIAAFQAGLKMDPNHLHSAAHYLLGQSLLRAGREQEGQQEIQFHQANVEGGKVDVATFERSKYTQARVPFKLDQPEKTGIKVRFVDATKDVFGEDADKYSGPITVINANRTGWSSLFVMEKQSFRLLYNANGFFKAADDAYPSIQDAHYSRMLVGDLDNDRIDDIIVLGDKGSHLFKFGTNGLGMDVSAVSHLSTLSAVDGVLMDLDFTGKLDLIAVTDKTNDLRVYRQFGPLLFSDITSTSGIPVSLHNAQTITIEDWNRDENMDVIASRKGQTPLLLEKQRGGPLIPREMTNWATGTVFCAGDFNNDLRPDLAMVDNGKINLCFNGGEKKEIPLGGGENGAMRKIIAIDYDNDGWLDLWTIGEKIRAWRNLGLSGFQETTAELGLDKFAGGAISDIHFADFDMDCDSDVVVALAKGGLRYLRNEGGNNNSQIKVQMVGNRSNADGIGCKVEIATGGLRLIRTVRQLPVEIGVGKAQTLDSFLVHWFNWPQGSAQLGFDCKNPLLALELTIQEGSCPYLYAWDGKGFRFVTDILGAAPLGLPIAEGRYIEADPVELAWIGNEQTFPPRAGNLELEITEELREVLYLDEAKLVVVDHEPGTEVHPTCKLLPGKPFPRPTIMTLYNEHALQRAETLDGQEITAALKSVDGRRVSPAKLRVPQLRGLAEPHGLVVDFGRLDVRKPLVLVMNGWLRFGGGMANIAASQDPSLPFPFPSLEAETVPGIWKPVDVTVGAPAGKTKTILVDLEGKLEPGTRRLRLTEAFELYWDRIALMEKKSNPETQVSFIAPVNADLHFRGFSALQTLPPDWPPTPGYDKVTPNSYWTVIPGGWCTRYGEVSQLVMARDESLALINSGDELSLKFAVTSLPTKSPDSAREFFLYCDGWDKDSDFHVGHGTTVAPLPFHGMNDQEYGQQRRPEFASDHSHQQYNTRWVEGRVLKQIAGSK
jgi:Flp pilus assembly protein TadD